MTRKDHQSAPTAGKKLMRDVADSVDLREGEAGVANYLRVVAQQENAPLKRIAMLVGLPLPVAAAVRRELEGRGYLVRGKGLLLSPLGRAFVAEHLDLQASAASTSSVEPSPGSRDVDPETLAKLVEMLKGAPSVRFELDQAPCTPETALRRAELMHASGAIEGRKILLLGDDDSVSLAIALYLAQQGRTKPVDNITIVEVDPGRIAFLRGRCADIGAAVTIVPHDLRDPLPDSLRGRFDVFQTDPPYTVEGASLFLRRAAEALRPGLGSLGFLSYGQPAAVDQYALFREIHGLGFAVKSIQRNFNRYEGAAVIGSAGQMIELEGLFRDVSVRHERYAGPMYTADKSERVRGYRCRACKKCFVLGERGIPATIGALKASGCPACGGRAFNRWKPDSAALRRG